METYLLVTVREINVTDGTFSSREGISQLLEGGRLVIDINRSFAVSGKVVYDETMRRDIEAAALS